MIAAAALALACAGAGRMDQPAQIHDGGSIRGPVDRKLIALEFTGHEFAEGGTIILDELLHAGAVTIMPPDLLDGGPE